ncbi:glycosyltransferase family 2 protein [Rhodanobacter sp. 7MK24]|uniref:glycosyltransferase family 2 protein n=1 Tax=Rhodanobacter sp. 7MK24 TaxID=2775922 RepID=UPI00177F3951|nr:glycosyltransferase family 2 protein [Rhodanobacter sp. 7MK24]MBD8880541.1 glycosyltransferase family 2 protein [Rhodanobacter sp. 7MK24]
MSGTNQPRVAIGMPVFNGEKTLADAIESVAQQTYGNFTLIISDNASTDATPKICQAMARHDSRIIYIRQESNIGAEANFDYVLRAAECEYFMWAAADDVRSPDFLALCVDFLDHNSDYIGATCPTRFTGSQPDPVAMGDRTLDDDDPNANIASFFDHWHANGRFYSLFRRSTLSFWLAQPKNFLGADWALIIHLLKRGKFRRLESGHVQLGRDGASNQLYIFSRYRSRLAHWIVPFLDLSRLANGLLDKGDRKYKRLLFRRLFWLNVRAARTQVVYEARILLAVFTRRINKLWRKTSHHAN